MSGELAVRAAALEALRGEGALMAGLNGLYDGTPAQAAAPYAVLGESLASDWGTKDGAGLEVRLGLSLFDREETPARLAGLVGLADEVMAGLSGTADDWRIGNVAFLRSRTVKARGEGWTVTLDYRVRVFRAD